MIMVIKTTVYFITVLKKEYNLSSVKLVLFLFVGDNFFHFNDIIKREKIHFSSL